MSVTPPCRCPHCQGGTGERNTLFVVTAFADPVTATALNQTLKTNNAGVHAVQVEVGAATIPGDARYCAGYYS